MFAYAKTNKKSRTYGTSDLSSIFEISERGREIGLSHPRPLSPTASLASLTPFSNLIGLDSERGREINKFLTFDSNSTSGFEESDVLKQK